MSHPTFSAAEYPPAKFEWPTLGLILLCTAFILLFTRFAADLPLWGVVVCLSVLLALHSSLQHEVLHGHPFRDRTLNEALVFIPFGVFLPYRRFRDSHIAHHNDPRLTDPYDDPESNYLDPAVWGRLGPFTRAILLVNNTLIGRIFIGPFVAMACFYKSDLGQIAKGNAPVIRAYALHFTGLGIWLWWMLNMSTLGLWAYILAAYLGQSILKIRTYLEHRAHENTPARTVLIEDRGPLAFLFLNNNFHVVHHEFPKLAWYHIPKCYKAHKAEFRALNQGYIYKNYSEIFAKYLFKRKDAVPHPLYPPKSG